MRLYPICSCTEEPLIQERIICSLRWVAWVIVDEVIVDEVIVHEVIVDELISDGGIDSRDARNIQDANVVFGCHYFAENLIHNLLSTSGSDDADNGWQPVP